jgi:hypothetical protein
MTTLSSLRLIAAAGLLLTTAACASEPQQITLTAALSSTQEVPPNLSGGGGDATVVYDKATRRMSWNVSYYSLTGPLTGAHFHGPAASNANAPVVVPMTLSPSPLTGWAVLNETQSADLLNGRWYVNLHTPTHPNGEIRGQLRQVKQ